MNTNNIIPIHQIGFPISFENIIPDSDSVRVLYDVMEGLDYTELNRTYSTIGRNPALLPKTMFAIIVYGYMEGIYSSRALEKACKRDINFKWLLQGQQPPEHNSIDRFRRERLAGCIENLFNQLVKKLRELVLCQEKVQIKFGQIVFVINMHFLHFLNSTYFHIHLEINIHNGCVFLLYYRMFLYIQKQVHMHVCNLKFYNDLTTLF